MYAANPNKPLKTSDNASPTAPASVVWNAMARKTPTAMISIATISSFTLPLTLLSEALALREAFAEREAVLFAEELLPEDLPFALDLVFLF